MLNHQSISNHEHDQNDDSTSPCTSSTTTSSLTLSLPTTTSTATSSRDSVSVSSSASGSASTTISYIETCGTGSSTPTRSTSKSACDGVNGSPIPTELQDLLPPGYQYHLCHINKLVGINYACAATLRIGIKTEETAQQWVKDFAASSYCTWRLMKSVPCTGRYVQFKNVYRCHHNTRAAAGANQKRKQPSKNTNCPTQFTLTVKISVTSKNKLSRNGSDKHIPAFPTVVNLQYNHNHNVMCADALKHRDVSLATQEKLIELFHKKHGPTTAHEALQYELQVKHGDDYYQVAADRAVCPDVGFCSRLYHDVFVKTYGKGNPEEVMGNLQDLAARFNSECGTTSMAVDITQDKQLIVAICTPLMQRVHTLHKYSGELCFMDASSNMDRHHSKVFLLLTHSCVGGLPIGVLVTQSETEQTIVAALKLYKSILPAGCFGGRGSTLGPELFITDDSRPERQAINTVFPQSVLLLCVFHVLQATWRWLWNGAHKVPLKDRPHYLHHMKRLVFASSEEDVTSLYEESMADSTLQKSFKDYIKNMYSRRAEWAVAYRNDLPTRGNNTNNYCEAAVRVLKDKVLSRTKAFNVPQLTDFVSTHLEDYYHRRIVDVASNRLDSVVTSKSMVNTGGITKDNITPISATTFKVCSTKGDNEYIVDTLAGCCTCYVGRTGGPCKHQAAAVKHFNASSLNFVPVNNPEMRMLLFKIATGKGGDGPSKQWFQGLQPTPNNSPMPSAHMSNPQQEASTSDMAPHQDLHAVTDSLQAQARVQNLFDLRKAPTATDVTNAESITKDFKSMCEEMLTKAELYPETIRPAMKAMVSSYRKNILSDSHLCSAMHTFGKYAGAAKAKRVGLSSRKAMKRGLQLKGTGTIGVQPTATARRQKPHMGRGGRRLGAGRPCKSSHQREHASQQSSSAVLSFPKKRKTAPHNLSQNVSQNQSIGRNHSKK